MSFTAEIAERAETHKGIRFFHRRDAERAERVTSSFCATSACSLVKYLPLHMVQIPAFTAESAKHAETH
jgi:hypothetical protein